MEILYNRFKDIAEFRIVYINEAHPCDGGEPSEKTIEKELFTHRSWQDRSVAASKFLEDHKLTIPCLIDDLDNLADLQYHAWPDKVYLVRSDRTIAVAGADGPVGFGPAMTDVRDWLLKYESSKVEPEPIIRPQDFGMILGAEIKPTGHQSELLELVDAFNAQRKAKQAERMKNLAESKTPSSEKKSPSKDSNAAPPTYVPKSKKPFDEAAHERNRESDAAEFPIKPWHIFAGTVLLIAVAIGVSRGNKNKVAG